MTSTYSWLSWPWANWNKKQNPVRRQCWGVLNINLDWYRILIYLFYGRSLKVYFCTPLCWVLVRCVSLSLILSSHSALTDSWAFATVVSLLSGHFFVSPLHIWEKECGTCFSVTILFLSVHWLWVMFIFLLWFYSSLWLIITFYICHSLAIHLLRAHPLVLLLNYCE